MNIYPSILSDDTHEVQEQLTLCDESGLVQVVQVDIIDGYFVDNMTVFPSSLEGMEFGDLELDFHLMTDEPIDFVREIADFKDELPIRAVIAQVERMSNQELFVDEVRRNNWKIGFSLNLHTPLEEIDPSLWERIHIIQLMSIEAGFQGQELQPYVFEKLLDLKKLIQEKDLRIEVLVDGGVSAHTINKLHRHGVTAVSVGSALWKSENFAQTYQELEAQAE